MSRIPEYVTAPAYLQELGLGHLVPGGQECEGLLQHLRRVLVVLCVQQREVRRACSMLARVDHNMQPLRMQSDGKACTHSEGSAEWM